MKKYFIGTVSLIFTLSLAACNNQDIGTLTGGALGGALASSVGGGHGKTAAIIGGTLLGAFIGGAIGKSMDDVDKMKAQQALETTPTNKATTWKNPDSGNVYTLTPTKTYTSSAGQACRNYTTSAIMDGHQQEIQGTACRDSAGHWVMK